MHSEILSTDLQRNLAVALRASLIAGDAVMRVYSTDFEVNLKSDQSPITEADRQSHGILLAQLNKAIPLLSEEGSKIAYEERKDWGTYWLIDPLDGTKEFVKRNGEFTINVALIEQCSPIAGIVYVPAKGILYFGARGFGSYRVSGAAVDKIKESADVLKSALVPAVPLPFARNPEPPEKIKVVQSVSHVSEKEEDFIAGLRAKFGSIDTASAGSSLKFCLVAEGSADLYPRFGPTMEWDTAAGQCIAESSGCEVLDLEDVSPVRYNKPVLRNSAFMVIGSQFRLESSRRKSVLECARASGNVSAHPK